MVADTGPCALPRRVENGQQALRITEALGHVSLVVRAPLKHSSRFLIFLKQHPTASTVVYNSHHLSLRVNNPVAISTTNRTPGIERLSTKPEVPMTTPMSFYSPNEHAPEEVTEDEQGGMSGSDGGWYSTAKIGFRKLFWTRKSQVLDSFVPKRTLTSLGRRKARDVRAKDIKETDTVIALMGPVGAGKTSFIRTTLGNGRGIDHGLESCTGGISVVRVRIPDEDTEVVLLDTPGFDDTHKSDFEILKLVSDWLKKTCEEEILLSGILYLHRISDNRMAGTPLKNLEMFRKLCGRDPFSKIIMVTTMWSELDEPEIGYLRENELKKTFWKPMLQRGSMTTRYDDTAESAWSILEHFLDSQRQHHITRLQSEMVHLKKSFSQTAGHGLGEKIGNLLKIQDMLLNALKKQMEKSADDDEIMAALQEQYSRLRNEREEALREYHALRGSEGRKSLSDAGHSTLKRAWAGLDQREVRDVVTENIKETDTVIVLMGPTGVGKTSFIDTAVGNDTGVGHGLKSCTSEISVVRVRVPDEDIEVVLLDTPGFDDTHKSDFEILKLVSDWLKKTCEEEILLSGILYLHRISDKRMAGTPLKNLEMFRELYGRDPFSNTIMVTTMWGELDDPEVGHLREHELKKTFWKPMLQRGTMTIRYDDTAELAWSILEHFLGTQRRITLLQNEIVELKNPFNKTAGYDLDEKIDNLLKTQDMLLNALKKRMEKSADDDEIQEQYSRLENERKETLKDYHALRGSEGRSRAMLGV